MPEPYQPSDEILTAYARVLVRFAPRRGKGLKKGDCVWLVGEEETKPLYVAVRNEILRAGGTVIDDYRPSGIARASYELASPEQLSTFHRAYYRGLAAQVDHQIYLYSSADLHELEGVDPAKMTAATRARSPFNAWREKKEADGLYTWTVCAYGTDALAAEAGMTAAEYWEQIVKSCYLDDPDPVARLKQTERELTRVKNKLTRLQIESVHVEADDGTDLTVKIGSGRKWLSGEGFNIPSFEIFTSPDWRGTEGTVSFTEPLYYEGAVIENVRLRFAAGEVVAADADSNVDLLREMIGTDPGAKRLGEFSLTDGRVSLLDRFMAETLFDENRGGPEGNFHVALGNAYQEAYTGALKGMRKRDWQRIGFNNSVIHTDIVSASRRRVTATLASGKRKLIYADGQFTI